MMSLPSDDKCSKGMCNIRRSLFSITNLPGDCLNLIFKRLDTRCDCNSFGLTCRQWHHIQNNNQESLWYYRYRNDSRRILQELSPECVPKVLSKLMSRFQNLKVLSLLRLPEITDYSVLQSQFLESKIQKLCLSYCFDCTDTELSVLFSWFPRLTYISIWFSGITDRGLEALAKCCSSLEVIDLPHCQSITDSGIRYLLQNCCKLRSLKINSCNSITGIGFLGCPKTLTHVSARCCKLKPEGIEAIVNGGGLEGLDLSNDPSKFGNVRGSTNTEAVIMISKACPLLKELTLTDCEGVELQGWEAIGQNAKTWSTFACLGANSYVIEGCKLFVMDATSFPDYTSTGTLVVVDVVFNFSRAENPK